MSEHQSSYYEKYYWNVQYQGMQGAFTNVYHKKIEKQHKQSDAYEKVLEIGGGTGEHLSFVKHSFSSYTLLDIAENHEGLKRIALDIRSSQIKFVLADASEVPFEDCTFNRILSTCVLHHVSDLEKTLTEIRRVAQDDALVDLYVPCDPGMLYRWVRHWTSHLKQKKVLELSWTEVKYLWALEHRNHYLGIMFLIKGIFEKDDIQISRFPLPALSWNLSLFSIVTIRVKKS